MAVLKQGYTVAVILAAIAFVVTSRCLLYTTVSPSAWWCYTLCGFIGMITGFVVVLITQFYTDFAYRPVKDIAQASVSGHGTNVIAGLAVGFESAFLPLLVVICAILSTYYLGKSTGLDANTEIAKMASPAGLYGTAVATMGHAFKPDVCVGHGCLWTNHRQ